MDPTFQIKYKPIRFVFNLMEIMITKQIPLFFRRTVLLKKKWPSLYSYGPYNNMLLDYPSYWDTLFLIKELQVDIMPRNGHFSTKLELNTIYNTYLNES